MILIIIKNILRSVLALTFIYLNKLLTLAQSTNTYLEFVEQEEEETMASYNIDYVLDNVLNDSLVSVSGLLY